MTGIWQGYLSIVIWLEYKSVHRYSDKCFYLGTRFRPLSLEVPKPLFPVAGYPLVEHHIAACKKVFFSFFFTILFVIRLLKP